MRILLLTPRVPYPPYRGDKLKIFNLIKRLARSHEIYLICFAQTRRDLGNLQQLRPYCKQINHVKLPVWLSLLKCFAGLFLSVPLQVQYFKSRRMQNLIDRACRGQHFDIIHTHLIRMAQYTAGKSGSVRVLDLTDAVSLYLERFMARAKNPLLKLLLKIELQRMMRYERLLEQFHACFVCSAPDREQLRKTAPEAAIELIPNGVDLSYFSTNGSLPDYDPDRIIFTGNLSYYPNIDGILHFTNDIFPLIKRERPSAKLYVVGQSPPAKVRALASPDVIVTGFVEDIKQYYLSSAVAVSPIRFGAGTLNKIIEPMALGVPVVATSVGVEGLEVIPGEDILVADQPQAFARNVVAVLQDSALREKLRQGGMAVIRKRYDWDAIVTRLEGIYQELVLQQSRQEKAKTFSAID
ncbi:MAG: glycosyltransferase family 4 protein [candidate division KSB1 bacterium]|nr:glycosyltransferase family 4 protein [candidate division KSB1 bacterium]MDZ7274367.1 glycosyltransferase family 4 protein [candidate division KSB1 bacterium]MDZ7284971.1 glycosyltransferase family 4 protein [candidate division KSB1 bacterium]MDZ7297608.1 glycosyltransferase family 4 protein [candidate division KSB1 bacterium]MDZ7306348.1 glycosyltransferase family 4 protein [candidate division KSB1 bacterium]